MDDVRAIGQLALRFTDAVNRVDEKAFAALWAPTATWQIDPPTDFTVQGAGEEIASTFVGAMDATYEFFVQLSFGILPVIEGDHARARSYLMEHGRTRAGGGYFNYGTYDDRLVRTESGWCFASRHYSYLYVDDAVPPGLAYARPGV